MTFRGRKVGPRRKASSTTSSVKSSSIKAASMCSSPDRRPEGSGPQNRHGMPVLPVGQHEVKNWPVLDLGEHPDVALSSWKLEVGGLVEHPFTLTWEQFLALPQVDDVSDFHCVTTWSRYDNHWRGVRFSTIAEMAVPYETAQYVLCTGYDFMPGSYIPYTTNLPLDARRRRRRAARPYLGGTPAAARTRRPGSHDHAEALRVEGHEVDPQDRVSRRRSARVSGKSAAIRTAPSRGSTTDTPQNEKV